MPWKIDEVPQQRWRFVQARLRQRASMTQLCAGFGISRACGYKWWQRFRAHGRRGLRDASRRSQRAGRLQQRWRERVLQLRHAQPAWGAPKLAWALHQRYRCGPWPAVRTLGAWLATAGLTRRRPQRARRGPRVPGPGPTTALAANDVWTLDFKGWFYTTDRTRVCALTVRDLATRYVLAVRHVRPREREVAAAVQRLFRRYGLPRAVRVDNGPPFGSGGPRGWTPLSVGWVKLGVRVEYGRPGCPQDNGAHEQMHRVLKAATARPAAPTLAAQQRRFARWRWHYNHARPHAALGQRLPAQCYRTSAWRLPARAPAWADPTGGVRVRLDARGRLRWRGRQRLVGRAFAHEHVALLPRTAHRVAVYLGPHLLGTLHAADRAGLRAVRWR